MYAVLVVASLTTIISFHQIDRRASILLLPYLAWTCYSGTIMNIAGSGHESADEVGVFLCFAREHRHQADILGVYADLPGLLMVPLCCRASRMQATGRSQRTMALFPGSHWGRPMRQPSTWASLPAGEPRAGCLTGTPASGCLHGCAPARLAACTVCPAGQCLLCADMIAAAAL